MSWVEDLKILSIHGVINEDGDYTLRHIFRWYSKTFSTPLHVVEALPLEDVLQAYFEEHYEGMNEVEREQEVAHLLETEESLRKRQQAEDGMDADTFEFSKKLGPSPQLDKAAQAVNEVHQAADQVGSALKELTKVMNPVETIKEEINKIKKIPSDISMKFIDTDDEFDEMLEGSFGPKGNKIG
jgi:vacuolar-type H+-ATPase subunit I/STV1